MTTKPDPGAHLAAITTRRARVAEAWSLTDEVVLIHAGMPIGVPGGADRCYRFIPHAHYRYLAHPANEVCPGGVVAFDPREGWVDFVPVVTAQDRVWERVPHYEGRPMTELRAWVEHRLGQRRDGSGLALLGVALADLTSDRTLSANLGELLLHARRPKDEIELERMRDAARATAAGFARAREVIRPGVTEREVQIEMEAAMCRAGADTTAYGSIVASGPNAAVLHWMPGDRVIGEDDLVLIDAGAEVDGYAADVTRTYSAGGELSGHRRAIHDLVLHAQRRAVAACIDGAEWLAIHFGAARDVVAGLIAMDLMRGDPEDLVERSAHTLFFPHGVGHLVGLGVRDASGRLPGREPSPRAPSALRMDLPLAPGYVPTVEPGCYMIEGLLGDESLRTKYAKDVNWTLADELRGIGGVRIEDDVVVRASGEPENLTAAIGM